MADLKDLVDELLSLNYEDLSQRVINSNDVQWCLSELYDMLAADVVEVVRCGECRLGKSSCLPEMIHCENNSMEHRLDCFCSYGEREEE